MYDFMSLTTPYTPIIERGIALHKVMSRSSGMVGLPAYRQQRVLPLPRRQFNLADSELLRYKFLNKWDAEMNKLEQSTGFLHKGPAYVSWKHGDDKMICFERAGLLFVFNFHATKSFPDYKVGVEVPGTYKMALNSDDEDFGGWNRLKRDSEHMTFPEGYAGRRNHLLVYAPARTCLVLRLL
ncbi:unnamed protein product [Cylicostephanus goldi]|uniref:Alpha-amylase/branching enzyme C-terminal all beta domain-containing protein n=1 Tax=Cylicostephanus goldi TaxID=71465 RepID=A0A3P7QQA8_CYLGO|nr:unnamed protein product [Cylicostephanus goldi]